MLYEINIAISNIPNSITKGLKMQYVILGLLILQPNTVYGLNKSFEQGISLFYSASFGSIQTTLRILLEKGWIYFDEQVENGRNKKVYSITSSGQVAFFEWMREPISMNKLEVTLLSKIYFLGMIESKKDRQWILNHMMDCVKQVESQLTGTEDELKKLEIPQPFQKIFYYQHKTLEYGIQSHQFALEWIKNMINDLEK